jgi:hypothetical protein
MNEILNFIDANPDSLVLPVLLLLLAIFTLGVFVEGTKVKKDISKAATFMYLNLFAACVVFWVIILYLGLLIFDICK